MGQCAFGTPSEFESLLLLPGLSHATLLSHSDLLSLGVNEISFCSIFPAWNVYRKTAIAWASKHLDTHS